MLIGNQYLQQLQDLQDEFDRKQIDQVTYEKRRQEILQQAALVGLLMLVGYAAPKLSKRFGVNRNKSLQGPESNWKSTQIGNTSKNSKILRENLGLQKGDGNEAHHIVPSTHPKGNDARTILDKYQIDINAKENGVGLSEAQHQKAGLHKHVNIEKINKRINQAQEGINNWGKAREAILAELENIKAEILNGLFP